MSFKDFLTIFILKIFVNRINYCAMAEFVKPKILLSRCLGISAVRYNGGIINDSFVEKLKKYVEYLDVCTEVDIGLGVPRQRMVIKRPGKEYRFIECGTNKDFTLKIIDYCAKISKIALDYDGAVLKAKSPSCGLDNANFYTEENNR